MEHFLRNSRQPQGFRRPLFCLFLGKALVFRAKTNIADDIHLKQLMLGVLEHQSHLCPQFPHVIVFFINIFPVKTDHAAGSTQKPVQMLGQRGFSGAGMADEADKLPVGDFQVDIF